MWTKVVLAAIVTSGLVGCADASDPRGEAPTATTDDITGARPFTLGGDWNDDIDTSIVPGNATPFAQFKNDGENYRFTTERLSAAGIGSTTGYDSTIDHHMVTNELAALFVPNSSWIERPTYIPDYRGTTSDHYPVITRYALR